MPDEPRDPLDDLAWRAHLFRTRSFDQVAEWARTLRFFRFCRSTPSPFLKEPDRLLVALAWRDRPELLRLLRSIGLTTAPRSGPGSTVSVDLFDGEPVIGTGQAGWAGAGWQDLEGGRVLVELGRDRVELTISGSEQRRTEIVDRDVDRAHELETSTIGALADHVIDPPIDDRSCVSPRWYPTLFAPR